MVSKKTRQEKPSPSLKETAANSEDGDVEARTIFVRNLPYTFSDSQLQEVFSEIGPVRRSFTIKEKGSEQCRGFGYVQFAIAEDAIRAVELKDGTDLHGRKVMVKLAKRRPSFDERRSKKQPNGETIKGELESLGAIPKRSSISKKSEKKELADATPNNRENAVDGEQKHSDQHGTLDLRAAASQKEQSVSRKGEKQKPHKVKLNVNVGVDTRKHAKHQCDAMASGENKKKRKRFDTLEDSKGSEKQKVARTVILGGLITPEMREVVLELAKKVGPVESVQSSLSPEELKGRGLEKDGCKMGAAAVVFTSIKAASQAVVKLHQKHLGNGTVWARQLGGEGSKPRKWRVIIRNLPFSVTEEKVRDLLASAGFVWEAKVPRKEDGQAKGFAFASFTSKADAEKAIRLMNGKTVQKRPIAVDWAVEKSAYKSATDGEVKVEDSVNASPSDIEDEETASEDDEDLSIKNHDEGLESENGDEELPTSFDEMNLTRKVLNRVVSSSLNKELEGDLLKQTDIDLDKVNKGPDASRHHSETKSADEEKNMQSKSGDLGKTVFIKNLPFDVDSDILKKHFSAFGKVKSTFVVLHTMTKRPKGTAFLEFQTAESAEAALAAAAGTSDNMKFAGGITLGGRKLEVLKALEKKSAEAKEKEKLEHTVDRRNLYLLKEGKISEGTPAANGVSEEDMSKRRQLEQVKATKLRSPSFHVSRTRLAVYNVPKSMNEAELRKIFIDAVKLRATKQHPELKQVKILKDEAKGATSRGVAFVEFTEHQHALVALRVLNNNPETFGPHRRPIVGFAIENLLTLKKRQERQLQAGQNNIDDLEASSNSKKKPKRRDKKSRISKGQAISDGRQGTINETEDQSTMDGKGHHDTDPNAKSTKSRPSVTHAKSENLPGKKRKRNKGRNLNNFDGELDGTHEGPPAKMQKLVKRNAKRDEINLVAIENKRRPSMKDDGFKKFTNRGLNPDRAYDVQEIALKATQKKKGLKFEVEDKLEKLVAVYRKKYFSDVTGGAKGDKNSGGMKASYDLKRWFE